ncbi:MAG: dihydropyrimidinase, partial [Chloroflexi bacterium]
MPKTLITNGTIVTAADTYKGDVLVDGEKIAMIGKGLKAAGAKRIDATGKYVIPGGIDVHTHMELPFGGTFASDDFHTGTVAAAFGGTTSIVDFAVQGMGEPLETARDTWLRKARGKAVVDYGLHMIVRDVTDKVLKEMDVMVICMHAENGGVIDVLVKRALAQKNTGPKWHALTRPPEAEAEATHRAFRLAEMAGEIPLYIVHLSSSQALEQVRLFRDRGLPAYAETCPQYLFLSIDNYDEPGFEGAKYVMSPPLREKWHQEELWKGLARNDLQVVSTDHCPFCMNEGFQGLPKQKQLGIGDFSKIPNGAPGVETRMVLLYDGGVVGKRITLNRWVEVTSTTPAKIMGMFPKKGTIAVGSDADIVIWDPRSTSTISAKTHHMRVDYNP